MESDKFMIHWIRRVEIIINKMESVMNKLLGIEELNSNPLDGTN